MRSRSGRFRCFCAPKSALSTLLKRPRACSCEVHWKSDRWRVIYLRGPHGTISRTRSGKQLPMAQKPTFVRTLWWGFRAYSYWFQFGFRKVLKLGGASWVRACMLHRRLACTHLILVRIGQSRFEGLTRLDLFSRNFQVSFRHPFHMRAKCSTCELNGR